MSWDTAKFYCRSLQAELISFRSLDLIPLIYTASSKQTAIGPLSILTAWTSARATDYSGGRLSTTGIRCIFVGIF